MGLLIKQNISCDVHGELSEFYVKIVVYHLDVINGKLRFTAHSYVSPEGVLDTHSPFIGEIPEAGSKMLSMIKYNDEFVDLNEYMVFEFSLTKEVTVSEDVFKDQTSIETEPYFDFDEHGEIIEKENTKEVTRKVKVGEQLVKKTKIDLSEVIEDLFVHSYSLLKKEYGKIFGEKNIIDL